MQIFSCQAQLYNTQNMTTRSLFNVILKILGIFFIKDILAALPELLSVFILWAKPDNSDTALMSLCLTLLILLIYVFVSYCLIFKSTLLIDKLKLDKGFDQEMIPLNIHRSTILSISIIVIGGLLIAQEIPNFCRQLFIYFEQRRLTYGQTNPSLSYCVLSGLKILVGLVLVGNQKQIVDFIELKRKR
jgi:hypothetical protein